MVRRFCLIVALVVGWLLAGAAHAETFNLANGQTITGELLSGSENDLGVQIKVGEGKYERVPWANFSQEDLKKFAKVQKLEPLVEPFIEISQEEKIKKTEVNIKQPPRLERPAPRSLIGALCSSGLGLFVVLLLFAANVYAGYEVSIFRDATGHPGLWRVGRAAVDRADYLPVPADEDRAGRGDLDACARGRHSKAPSPTPSTPCRRRERSTRRA